MNDDMVAAEWEKAQKLLLIDLPITIQKIVKKAYPSIFGNEALLNDLEEKMKKIAITEIEAAIATCKTH